MKKETKYLPKVTDTRWNEELDRLEIKVEQWGPSPIDFNFLTIDIKEGKKMFDELREEMYEKIKNLKGRTVAMRAITRPNNPKLLRSLNQHPRIKTNLSFLCAIAHELGFNPKRLPDLYSKNQ